VTARTPLIAGNWKMYKTEREAEDYIQALLPRVSSIGRRGRGDLRAVHRPAAMVDSARGSRVRCTRRTCIRSPRVRSRRGSPLMLSDAGVQASWLGTPTA